MTRLITYFAFGLLIFLSNRCLEPYTHPGAASSKYYLVVDGMVDSGTGNAHVILTRSQALDTPDPAPPESGAGVSIEINNSQTRHLAETSPGVYTAGNLAINAGDQCRLRIHTADGMEYASAQVTSRDTPPIDSVTWAASPQGLEIQVTTHDPTGNTRYYRWRYVETAMYHSTFASGLIWDDVAGMVRSRTREEHIFYCWKTTPSPVINVFSTGGLAEDIVYKYVVNSLPPGSWKLSLKYSIIVKQYAIGEEEYNFWSQLKKNTELVGTIFDPQPSQVRGNISAMGPAGDPVLGYFSVSSVSEQRIYILRDSLPYSDYVTGYEMCNYSAVDTIPAVQYYNSFKSALLIGSVPGGFTSADKICIDCRITHDGSNRPPDFWE